MQHRRRPVHAAQALTLAAGLACFVPVPAGAADAKVPAAVASAMPSARLAGQARLTVWGFDVYDAQLWTAPGFNARHFERHAFALELAYLRALKSADIASKSIEQMRRAGTFSDAQAQSWEAQLRALLPNVRPGDRISGVNLPDRGASFYVNGKPAGEVADPQFASLFFAIWLAPTTSEPSMRAALLGNAP